MEEQKIEGLRDAIDDIRMVRKRINDLSRADFTSIEEKCNQLQEKVLLEKGFSLLETSYRENRDLLTLLYGLAWCSYCIGKNGDNYLKELISRLERANKSSLAESLLKGVVEKHQPVAMMQSLASIYERERNFTQQLYLLEKIIEIDETDYLSCLNLAHHFEKEDKEKSCEYFQLAFNRTVSLNKFREAEEVLRQMITSLPKMVPLHLENIDRLLPHVGTEKRHDLFAFLLKRQEKNTENPMEMISKITKTALTRDIVLHTQLFLLLKAYREIYKDHPKLEDYLVFSGLIREVKSKKTNKSARTLLSALESFEKHISFSIGSYVRHKAFGEGVIRGLKEGARTGNRGGIEPKLKIDFKKKPNHEMSLRIAVGSLTVISPDNLLAMKLFAPEKLANLLNDMSETGKEKLLSAICYTLEKPSGKKEMTKLVEGRFFSKEDWSVRFNDLKQFAQESEKFTTIDNQYWFNERGENYLQATERRLRKHTKPHERIKVIERFFSNQKKEKFEKLQPIVVMIEQWIAEGKDDAIVFLAILYHLNLKKKYNYSYDYRGQFKQNYSFEKFLNAFLEVSYHTLQHSLLGLLKAILSEKEFAEVLKSTLLKSPFEIAPSCVDFASDDARLFKDCFDLVGERYQDYPSAFLHMVKHGFDRDEHWFETSDALVKTIRLLVQFQLGTGAGASGEGKKLFNLAGKILFDDDRVFLFLENCKNEEEKNKILKELENCSFLENYQKVKIRQLK